MASNNGSLVEPSPASHLAREEEPAQNVRTGLKTPALAHPLKYRADIDGLRAISVAAVILFHMAPTHVRGGGIGVDVFFVISGYLIGGMILASTDAGRFSFADFYYRRVRRIAPAFLATILISTIAALILLYPWELTSFSQSALAALGCVSNIYFYLTSDYFAPDSSTLPLLHTWTLAVEEQFYFAFPILVWTITRGGGRKSLIAVLIGILCVSLAISEVQARTIESAAFYLLPSRGWELMLGVVAARIPPSLIPSSALRLTGATIGLILVLASIILLRPEHHFPGLTAVPPCFGAVLLLVSGQGGGSLIHRALSVPPMRLAGLASYSLYLWHWPIIVFFKTQRVIGKLAPIDILQVGLIIMVVGFASWHFIERPFRTSAMTPRRLFAWCGASAAVAVAMQCFVLLSQGLPQRIPPKALALARYSIANQKFPMPSAQCFLPDSAQLQQYDQVHCLTNVPTKRNWLLVGDSHAAMLYGGLLAHFPDIHFQSAVVFACDIRTDANKTGRICDDLMNYVFSTYLPSADIEGVVLESRWGIIRPEQIGQLAKRLRARRIKLLVIGPTPEYTISVTRLLAESVRRNDPGLLVRAIDPRVWRADRQLREAAAHFGFDYASPMAAMCPGHRTCMIADTRGMPLYFDAGHYNAAGSSEAIRRLVLTDSASGGAISRTLGIPG